MNILLGQIKILKLYARFIYRSAVGWYKKKSLRFILFAIKTLFIIFYETDSRLIVIFTCILFQHARFRPCY